MRSALRTLCLRIGMILLMAFSVSVSHARSQSAIDTVDFQGASLQQKLCVYRPSGYTPERRYPVLYLLHGVHGNQYDWSHKGRIQAIMDSLIACGQVEPLIVVMPYGQTGSKTDSPDAGSLFMCCMHYPGIRKQRFEHSFCEIDSCIASRYSVRRDLEGRAIAGNSCGARQAANLVKDSTFCACGLFSPVITRKQLPPEGFNATEYWLGGGKKDIFLFEVRNYNRQLQRRGCRVVTYRGAHGHSWLSWQEFVILFAERYFPAQGAAKTEATEE